MIIVTAPNEDYSIETQAINTKVFVAGGIQGCPKWQNDFFKLLEEKFRYYKNPPNITFYNPRRQEFDITDPNESIQQICWEHKHLKEADIIIYWFSKGSLNPIVLFELGKFLNSDKEIIVGIDPEYERKFDVEIQTMLDRPELYICRSLVEIVEELKELLDK